MSSVLGAQSSTILIVSWVFTVLAILVMAARLYVAVAIRRSIYWDFFFALMTLVLGLVGMAFLTLSVIHGIGRHANSLDDESKKLASFYTWFSLCFAIIGYATGKIAIIVFLLRLQGPTHLKKGYFLHLIAYSNVLFDIIQSILLWTQCSPFNRLWDRTIPGTCTRTVVDNDFGDFQGSWSALTDLILSLYPILLFKSLQIPLKTKIGVCVLCSAGVFSFVCGAIKTYEIKAVSNVTDFSYAEGSLSTWAWVEYWIVLIAGSIPPLHPLFVRIVSSFKASFHSISRLGAKGAPIQYRHAPNTFIPLKEDAFRRNHHVGQGARDEGSREAIVGAIEMEIGVSKEFSVTAEQAQDADNRAAGTAKWNSRDLGLPHVETRPVPGR